ncbi:MAG: galactokinase [Vicinamibacteria bacterium]
MSEAFVARAPGRLDVMGGIADYSGSLVLQLPLREATTAAIQRDESRTLTAVSAGRFTIALDDLDMSYEEARAYFRSDPSLSWAGYVAGAFVVLMREKGVDFSHGARLEIHSSIPMGRGVASSAALEVATMMAIDGLYRLGLDPREVALLCQKVENEVVGAPSGVMDPMTSVFGEENRLLALLCQPAKIEAQVPVPEGLSFWGIDSGIAHAVSGPDYASVRSGAFMGYRILCEMSGADWGGYLANVTPSELDSGYFDRLPETMIGGEFLERFGGTSDTVTTIDPKATYRVRQPAAHPVREHFRVRSFARLLAANAVENAPLLGELMYQSHASYSACGLGSEGTDLLVALAREAGPSHGIHGAKITGGGCGGTVAILGAADAERTVVQIAEGYARKTGMEPFVFRGSSPGARAFGLRRRES